MNEARILTENLSFIFNELQSSTFHRERIKRRIKRLYKQNRLHWEWNDTEWAYRMCVADLANGRYRWKGWECRNKWAWRMSTEPQAYPPWDGRPCKLLVMAEQGIGDEILYASCLSELHRFNPDLTVECDHRLFGIFRRSFPGIEFIDRHRDDEGTSKYPDSDYEPKKYDAFIPLGNVPKLYRRKKADFPGTPYLKPLDLNLDWQWLFNLPSPLIGISWQGRQGSINPTELMQHEGTYISLQYDADPPDDLRGTIDMAPNALERKIIVPPIDLRRNIEGVFALVNVLDYVVCVPTSVAHFAGAVGTRCHVVRPPALYAGDNPEKPEVHNRLRYEWGRWTGRIPWYQSIRTYPNLQAYRRIR